jgi:hypothetical protein
MVKFVIPGTASVEAPVDVHESTEPVAGKENQDGE